MKKRFILSTFLYYVFWPECSQRKQAILTQIGFAYFGLEFGVDTQEFGRCFSGLPGCCYHMLQNNLLQLYFMLKPVYNKRIFLWCSPALSLFLLFSLAGHTQSTFRQYTTEHGLPSSETYDVLEDDQGFIWIATDNGVSRYDGYRFESFGPEEGLGSPVVLKLYKDYKGRIWFCTLGRKLYYYENDLIKSYPYNNLIEQYPVRFTKHIYLSRQNTMTVALPGLGFIQIEDNGSWKLDTFTSCDHVLLLMDKHEILPSSGICRGFDISLNVFRSFKTIRAGKVIDKITRQSTRVRSPLYFIVPTKNKSIICQETSLFSVENGKISTQKIFPEQVVFFSKDGSGQFYLQLESDTGLRKYSSLENLLADQGERFLEGYSISGSCQDRNGGLWFTTTNKGVLYIPPREIYAPILVPDAPVTAVSMKNRSELYAGLQRGDVVLVKNGAPASIREVIPPSYGDSYPVFDLIYDTLTHSLWKGAGGLFERKKKDWLEQDTYPFFQKYGIENNSILGTKRLFISSDGVLWGVNPGSWGFSQFDLHSKTFIYSSAIEVYRRKTALHSIERTTSVFEDLDGNVWVGTIKGLFAFTPSEALVRPPLDHPAFRLRVEDIHQMADSSLVIGTKGGGVLLWKGDSVRSITTEQGLTSDMIERVHVDSAQHIWVGTLSGLNQIRFSGPDSFRVYTYTLADGMPSNEITDIDSYGDQVWVGTTRGLVKMPTRFAVNPFSPAPLLRGLTVNGSFRSRDSLAGLAYYQNNLQVDLLAVNPRMNGRIRYRYRLRPGEAWTYTTDRLLNFPRLRPDAYRLEAQAENEDGVWSTSSVLPFSIRPALWDTWWFRGLLGLLAGGALFAGIRGRIRRLRKEAETQRERAELQTELHELERAALRAQMNPHFLSNCLNSIQGLIVRGEKEAAMRYLAVFHRLLRQTLDLSQQKRVSLEEDIELLKTYLELERMRSGIPFRYEIRVDPALDAFELEVPPLLVQPYVENAVLHAFAPHVRDPAITIAYRPLADGLEVQVLDNGIGIRQSKNQQKNTFPKNRSYGMDIPRRRLELLADSLQQVRIEERKGESGAVLGTSVTLHMPTRQ